MSSIGYTDPSTGRQVEIEIRDGSIRAPKNAYEAQVIASFEGTDVENEIRSIGGRKAGVEKAPTRTRSSKRRAAPVVDPQLAETGESVIAEPEKAEG